VFVVHVEEVHEALPGAERAVLLEAVAEATLSKEGHNLVYMLRVRRAVRWREQIREIRRRR